MSGESSKASRKKWIYFSVGLLCPGFGHACLGYYKAAVAIFLFLLAYIVAGSYLAALTPVTMILALVTSPLIAICSATSAYRLSKAPRPRATKWLILSIVIPIVLFGPIRHLERVVLFSVPTDAMSPSLVTGDHFALDQRPAEYRIGDIVAIKLDHPRRITLRRIKSISGEMVSVAVDSGEYLPTEVRLQDLRGKALYIVYSRRPGEFGIRADRLLLPIGEI
jgi:hypothetical protein